MTTATTKELVDERISTHILTKRMTDYGIYLELCNENFNSHPHEEDDFYTMLYLNILSNFNSHPHEEDDTKDSWCAN